ncbi:hypothetical protein PUN28_001297 [Cardiocondyla obscurior]|uniref:Uncharacterized protein n=1 Tax=Cardiocondyla obscurior TaxID=286306 RepID=A0AAW2H4C9_9HYME
MIEINDRHLTIAPITMLCLTNVKFVLLHFSSTKLFSNWTRVNLNCKNAHFRCASFNKKNISVPKCSCLLYSKYFFNIKFYTKSN